MSFQLDTAVKNQHKGFSNHSSSIWNYILCTVWERGRWVGGGAQWLMRCVCRITLILHRKYASQLRLMFYLSFIVIYWWLELVTSRWVVGLEHVRQAFVQGDFVSICDTWQLYLLLFVSICCRSTCLFHFSQPHFTSIIHRHSTTAPHKWRSSVKDIFRN